MFTFHLKGHLHSSLRYLFVALQTGHGHWWAATWSQKPAALALLHPACSTKSQLSFKAQFESYWSLRKPPVLLGCQQLSFLCSHFLQLSLGLLRELPQLPFILSSQPICPFFDVGTLSHTCLFFSTEPLMDLQIWEPRIQASYQLCVLGNVNNFPWGLVYALQNGDHSNSHSYCEWVCASVTICRWYNAWPSLLFHIICWTAGSQN